MGRSVIGMPVSTCVRRHVVETPLRVCGKHTENYGKWKIMENHGKSSFLIGKSTKNGHVQ
jgi:hypothetical protein